ncbi:extracellular solute-binding protein [Microbacterium rhizosphaerae]|uniref:Extracellular solute-binding protein n=1 Tax=Microbacterium rhizosphaerae TaxID=1678237 RepID=A0ABZ0SLG7_9MICO|nr:extracellular solute-binding protein [Microbacterium rhizosphaerae]WPR89799.1 extracellular solute-binding protein [Microbacterium rhizosphaerae]
MTAYRGLTWDHPRGRTALRAAAERLSQRSADRLSWDAHPLEGFESTPIEGLAREYDLIVLDHPHLGDALEHDCLRPLDELFPAGELAAWAAATVGPSFASYSMAGRTWALPLDAATQVAARRADLLPAAPTTWTEALELARASGAVAPSLAGPHAFLTWCSIAAGLGTFPAGDDLFPHDVAREAFDILRELATHAPPGTAQLNPIELLERLSTTDDVHYVPLVYGYVTYATGERPVSFGAPPHAGGRIGSTLGGTGIAITRRTAPSAALLDHLRWLMSAEAQTEFIPRHEGQPSARAAWTSPALEAWSGGFYRDILTTIEDAWVRPRFPGFVAFQSAASALLRDALVPDTDADPDRTLDRLEQTLRAARRRAERTAA